MKSSIRNRLIKHMEEAIDGRSAAACIEHGTPQLQMFIPDHENSCVSLVNFG
jgi:hypothetical protein